MSENYTVELIELGDIAPSPTNPRNRFNAVRGAQ